MSEDTLETEPSTDGLPTLIAGTFDDGDEFCSAASLWNIEFRQLDCGDMHTRLDQVFGKQVNVQRFEMKRRFHQQGVAPDNVLTFGLPDDCRKLKWYGRPMERDSILNFNRRSGFDAVSDENFNGFTFSIHLDALQSAGSSIDASFLADRVSEMSDNFAISAADVRRMRILAFEYYQRTEKGSGDASAYRELESSMAHILAKATCESKVVQKKSSYAQRQLAVNRALQVIESTRDALSVSDLYKHSAVSWRTLDRAFKERFGISPKQYMVATRLAGVRRDLLAARRGTRITDIANDWGFWHLGRFAADYKQQFGELPSQTRGR